MTGRELMTKPSTKLGAQGFTLVEMMVTLVVVAVLLAMVMPNLAAFGANSRLTAAAEPVYSHIELARSEAVARSVPVFLNFGDTGDAEWTYGMSVNADCAVAEIIPTGTDACVMVCTTWPSPSVRWIWLRPMWWSAAPSASVWQIARACVGCWQIAQRRFTKPV